jgi:hypothetical protein
MVQKIIIQTQHNNNTETVAQGMYAYVCIHSPTHFCYAMLVRQAVASVACLHPLVVVVEIAGRGITVAVAGGGRGQALEQSSRLLVCFQLLLIQLLITNYSTHMVVYTYVRVSVCYYDIKMYVAIKN